MFSSLAFVVSQRVPWPPVLLGARTLLVAPGLTTSNKKLLVTRTLLVHLAKALLRLALSL